MNIDENTSIDDLLEIAKQVVNQVKPKEIFLLKDLFRGFEWNRIQAKNRKFFGIQFRTYVENNLKSSIEILDKTPQNQQKYRKK